MLCFATTVSENTLLLSTVSLSSELLLYFRHSSSFFVILSSLFIGRRLAECAGKQRWRPCESYFVDCADFTWRMDD